MLCERIITTSYRQIGQWHVCKRAYIQGSTVTGSTNEKVCLLLLKFEMLMLCFADWLDKPLFNYHMTNRNDCGTLKLQEEIKNVFYILCNELRSRKRTEEKAKHENYARCTSPFFVFYKTKGWLLFHNINLHCGRLHTLLLNLNDTYTHKTEIQQLHWTQLL